MEDSGYPCMLNRLKRKLILLSRRRENSSNLFLKKKLQRISRLQRYMIMRRLRNKPCTAIKKMLNLKTILAENISRSEQAGHQVKKLKLIDPAPESVKSSLKGKQHIDSSHDEPINFEVGECSRSRQPATSFYDDDLNASINLHRSSLRPDMDACSRPPESSDHYSSNIHAELHRGQYHYVFSRVKKFREHFQFQEAHIKCRYCSSLMWIEERMGGCPLTNPVFQLCCRGGLISLPLLRHTPMVLQRLLDGDFDEPESKFMENIRQYNSMFAFTSMGGKIDRSIMDVCGPFFFRISGANYHRIGSLLPTSGDAPKFAQLYIYDTIHENQNRIAYFSKSDKGLLIGEHVVELLKNLLDSVNPYVKIFRTAGEIMKINACVDLHIRIISFRKGTQFDAPSTDEIAALIVGTGLGDISHRDIIISPRAGPLQRINELHPCYMPLQYPILFPYREDGCATYMKYNSLAGSSFTNKFISMREFYSYRLQYREFEGHMLLSGGRLFQQYIVDAFAAIEEERLHYVRNNQQKFRAEIYNGLRDTITSGENIAAAIGKRYILPSSFYGGPRYMFQNYQDAIAIVRHLGPPDFFITFTCNPNWREIRDALKQIPGQKAGDRPDIVARVFQIKKKQFIKDVKKLFIKVIACIL